MEKQVVERRMATLMGHFAGNEEVPSTHILPMEVLTQNCSSTLNAVMRRCDNRTFFSRQCSQGPHLRLCAVEDSYPQRVPTGVVEASSKNPIPASTEQIGKPIFSRPTQPQSKDPTMAGEPMKRLPPEPPMFARPKANPRQPCVTKIGQPLRNGMEWSPRMDIVQSGSSYAVTIELPGVGINDVRVEVDDRNLIVTGKRTAQWQKTLNFVDSMYIRQEISQGPYEVVWPIPKDANKDRISAEFVDGFLQISLPKF